METIIYIILDALITGFIVFLAGKLTAVDVYFKEAVICVGVSSLVGLIPAFGWALSIFTFFYLLKRFTSENVWPDLILLVIVSKLLSFLTLLAIGGF